jgi:drug/metabolite transporter (DMT)-like permease
VASAASVTQSRPAIGVILMVVAMLTIPLVDGTAKYLSADYSPVFLGWARYVIASAIVVPIAAAIHGRGIFPAERLGSHLLRTIFLIASMTLYFLAIARIPLATAASAYFVAPIVGMLLAVVILRERMTARKVLSVILGFVGSLIILRPGSSIDPGILLALGSGFSFAFYIIVTRQAAQGSDPVKTLVFQCVVGAALLTPFGLPSWSMPAWNDLVFFLVLGVFSSLSHMLSITAFKRTDASTLAPLVYVELIGAALIGYLAFGEIPGLPTVIGAGLIVAAGLILLQRRNGLATE